MPTKGYTSPEFRYSRTWVRNGPGPKVPHPFYYKMAVIRRDKSEGWLTLDNGGAGTHPGSVPAALRLRLATKMREKAYESMQLGADIGEGAQTLQLISGLLRAVRSPLKTIGTYMRKAARRKKRAKRGVDEEDDATQWSSIPLKDVPEAFLGFQYGVRPLMGAIESACEIFQRPYPRNRVRHSCETSYSDAPYFSSTWPTGYMCRSERVSHEVELKGSFVLKVDNPHIFSAEQMGLLNVASVAWELVPFSFVVDWFIPVGRYVASLSDYAGCSFVDAYETEFIRSKGSRIILRNGTNDNRTFYLDDESVSCRRVLGVTGLPKVTAIDLKLNQSKEHIANGIALILALKK